MGSPGYRIRAFDPSDVVDDAERDGWVYTLEELDDLDDMDDLDTDDD